MLIAASILLGLVLLGALFTLLHDARGRQLNLAGYVLMGASMFLFILAGFRAH